MPLPQPDPSNPALPAPLFADVDAVRGDHLRANNQLIWENLQYLFDFTGRTTDTLTEGATNLYYTDVRAKAAAIAAALTGYAAGSDAAIAATDTILQAFAKTQGQVNALALKGIKFAQISDTQATNTAGATSTGGYAYDKRNLNTEDFDPDNIVAIPAASNNFVPIAGNFILNVRAAAYQLGHNRLKLRNVTAGADVTSGDNCYLGAIDAQTWATLSTRFTANGTDAYAIYHMAGTAKASGFGLAINESGVSERYLAAELILKV